MEITSESIQVQIPYYLTQAAKENLAKALRDFPQGTNYYTSFCEDVCLQGDGWDALELIRFETGEKAAVKGIILSNSCDISSENKRDFVPNINFVPIIKLERYLSLLQAQDPQKIRDKTEAIRMQRISHLFFLPKGSGLDEDYIAVLNDVHTIPLTYFRANEDKRKIFTLSQVGFYLFIFKLSIHFCRFHENVDRH